MRLTRRLLLLAPALSPFPARAALPALAALEARHGGTLALSALDTGTGARLTHRPDARVLMCSTFKAFLAAGVLDLAGTDPGYLNRPLHFTRADLLPHSPISTAAIDPATGKGQLSIGSAAQAAVETSDNLAANLLLDHIGGPPALTQFLRRLGDTTTRCDRREPALNHWDGDQDTSTPSAVIATVQTLVLGNGLTPSSRALLTTWLKNCATGHQRLRAGIPASWIAADKTGTGFAGEINDWAIFWPPGRAPILAAAFYRNAKISSDEGEHVLRETGRIVADWAQTRG